MRGIQGGLFDGVLEESVVQLRNTFVEAIPKLVTALLFLVVAYVAIKLALTVVRSALDRVYAGSELVADLFTTIAAVFLWFAAALTLLKILGMGEIAASLGTATGFIALGVSYALSDMIADTVAGVYLLRDPDFNPGDTVETADVTGVVRRIDLRKTRLEVDGGDTVVMGNSSVEEKWTKKGETEESEENVEVGESEESETDPASETAPVTGEDAGSDEPRTDEPGSSE